MLALRVSNLGVWVWGFTKTLNSRALTRNSPHTNLALNPQTEPGCDAVGRARGSCTAPPTLANAVGHLMLSEFDIRLCIRLRSTSRVL